MKWQERLWVFHYRSGRILMKEADCSGTQVERHTHMHIHAHRISPTYLIYVIYFLYWLNPCWYLNIKHSGHEEINLTQFPGFLWNTPAAHTATPEAYLPYKYFYFAFQI